MKLHIYAENRRKSKAARKRKKSSQSGFIAKLKRVIKWLRNLLLILIALSILITLTLRWINPPYTSFMLAQRITTDFVPYKINWVPLEEISPQLWIAVVAAEDQKFPNHHGFDLEACLLYTSPSPRDKRQSRMPSSA